MIGAASAAIIDQKTDDVQKTATLPVAPSFHPLMGGEGGATKTANGIGSLPGGSYADVFLPESSPTLACHVISGHAVTPINRYIRREFWCQECLHYAERTFCIGAPMRVGTRKHSTDKASQVYTWLLRGQFCTMSCMFLYVRTHPDMFPWRTIPLARIMCCLAYRCNNDIPLAIPRWRLPPFQSPLTPKPNGEGAQIAWSIHAYRRSLSIPIQSPDPQYHLFEDEPSYMLADSLEVELPAIRSWLPRLRELLPKFAFAVHYSPHELRAPRFSAPLPQPTGTLSSSSTSAATGDVLVSNGTTSAPGGPPGQSVVKRTRGRPRKDLSAAMAAVNRADEPTVILGSLDVRRRTLDPVIVPLMTIDQLNSSDLTQNVQKETKPNQNQVA